MPCATDTKLCVRFVNIDGRNNERRGSIPSSLQVSSPQPQQIYGSVSSMSLDEEHTTYWNEAEAQCVIALINDILDKKLVPAIPKTIGVITPYQGQVQLLKNMASRNKLIQESLSNKNSTVSIEINTVDGYQGRERDIIIFSSVRSNPTQRIGFLHDWRRLNVALTRAKSALIICGDLDCLSSADKYWAALTKWMIGIQGVVVFDKNQRSSHLAE